MVKWNEVTNKLFEKTFICEINWIFLEMEHTNVTDSFKE